MLLSCGKKDDKPAPTSQPAVTTASADAAAAGAADCATRVARLEGDLRELAAAKPGFMPLVQGIDAPAASGAQPVSERGWVIAVARDGTMSIQGHRFEATTHTSVLEDVRSYTDSMFKLALEKAVLAGGSSRDLVVPLYIWADREAPARVIAELVTYADPEGPWPPRAKRAPAGDPPPPEDDPPPPEEEDVKAARKAAIEQARKAGILGGKGETRPSRVPMRLLVAGDGAAKAPASPLDPKLPASEPASTNYLVAQLKAAIGDCPAIITTLAVVGTEGLPAKESEKAAKDIPAGLAACACKVADADAFEQGMRTWFGAWAPPLAWVAMPKLEKQDKRTIGQVLKP